MISKNLKNKSFSIGAYEFIEKNYKNLELYDIIDKLKSKGIPLDKLVKGTMTYKVNHNLSINKCGDWMNQPHILNQFQLKSFNKKCLYRSLEILGQNEELILSGTRNKVFSKYKFKNTDSSLDWSSIVLHGKASPIGKHGYSSDRRPDKEQITFGIGELRKPLNIPFVLTVKQGNVPSKKHFEDTFLQSVKHLNKGSLVIIDRGANTKPNKELIISKGMHYLTARILSNKDNELISQFSKNNTKKIVNKKKEATYCKRVKQDSEYLYVCYSESLYNSQMLKKQRKIDKQVEVIKKLSEKLKAGKKVKLKSIGLSDKIVTQEISLQERLVKISDEELRKQVEEIHIHGREGFYILESSKNLTENQALNLYKGRDSVEKTINSLKNEIEIKPVRVWTESSIKGALIIGFLVQLFISLARFEHDNLKSLSTSTILNSIKNLTLTIKHTKNNIIDQIISNIDTISRELLPNLELRPP